MSVIPPWLPDFIGTVSGVCLAVPTWRATSILKSIHEIKRDAAAVPRQPQNDDFVSHGEVVKGATDAMLEGIQSWNARDDVLLKVGVVLLIVSFAVRLIPC